MIFDEICKEIEFKKKTKVKGEFEYLLSTKEYHLAEMLNKNNKISFVDLLNRYEDDKDKVTISFNENDGITHANVYFYDTDDEDTLIAEIELTTFNGFNVYMSTYCGGY